MSSVSIHCNITRLARPQLSGPGVRRPVWRSPVTIAHILYRLPLRPPAFIFSLKGGFINAAVNRIVKGTAHLGFSPALGL